MRTKVVQHRRIAPRAAIWHAWQKTADAVEALRKGIRLSAVPKQRAEKAIDKLGLLTKEMVQKSVGKVRQCYEEFRALQIVWMRKVEKF